MTERRVTVIVLAGGRSSRFGRDKLAQPIGDRTLLEHAIGAVRPFATEILAVVAPDASPIVAKDVRVVHDASPFGGPLVGLATGLDQASEATVLLTAGDVAELVPEVVELLFAALDEPGHEVALLAEGDRPAPFPMAMRRDSAREAAARIIASGERRLSALVDALTAAVIEERIWRAVDPTGRSTRDIDTPADLP